MKYSNAFAIYLITAMLFASACTHETVLVDPIPTDPTGNPGDPPDTTATVPCEDGVVYFEKDVLPILISNCSVPGCHDDASHQDGIVLTSYEKVMSTAKVKPFDLDAGDLYEVITENDPDKRMPQPPQLPLTQDQVRVIRDWINQGALNLACENDAVCNTTNVTFSQIVNPLIITNCRGCHSGPNPSGGIFLGDYAGVRSASASGSLYGAISHAPGFIPMPRNRGPLPDCEVAQIKAWIDAGMQNN
jgi:hypothetical protein